MNRFDYIVIHFLNNFAHRSPAFDGFIFTVEESNLLKGGIALALFWWAWFDETKPDSDKRSLILFAFLSSSLALLLGRVVSLLVPFRQRPFENPLYHFHLPYTVTGAVHSWNSSPSDHAVLFFCLATCLYMISRSLGIIALLHAIFVISLPRIYVGYHFPTDILAGAALGIAAAFLCKLPTLHRRVMYPAIQWMEKHPSCFYAFAFFVTFEVGELFESLLELQSFARHALAGFIRSRI
jgi:undecaprenyl-diphosphatase